MRVENSEIAAILERYADLLEIDEGNPFRVRAYREAAQSIRGHSIALARMLREGTPLNSLRGIGKDMAVKIEEILETERLRQFEELSARVPPTLIEITRLNGVGPKKARALWKALGVCELRTLEEAAREGRVAGVAGFGEKTQARILAAIAERLSYQNRFKLSEADEIVQPLLDHLRGSPGLETLEVAGSYRRRRETVGDIDLLGKARSSDPVMERFLRYPRVREVRGSGGTRATVILDSGLQVDLRIVGPESYGSALVYFTGSKDHCIALRRRAIQRGLKLSEYGLFRAEGRNETGEEATGPADTGGERVAGATEEEVYSALDLSWIPPELRENAGEVEAAASGALPRLVRQEDLRGDLQMHTTWSDGKGSIEEMVLACIDRGYRYLAVTDHSKSLSMIGGLDADRLRLQQEEIAEVAARHPEIRILRGMEVDILGDGSLDLEDEMLGRLDFVLVAVHSRLELPEAVQTERILKALRHPRTNMLAHPTARQINRRSPIRLDLEAVLRCARDHGVAVEVNAQPDRLDLKDTDLRLALRLGLRVAINTDAHQPSALSSIRYGVDQARRGWCRPEDVLNTWPIEDVLRFLSKEEVTDPAAKRVGSRQGRRRQA